MITLHYFNIFVQANMTLLRIGFSATPNTEEAGIMQRPYNLLIVCTGNSARSIMAEALFNTLGKGRFKAYSAGSHPAGKISPFAIELVRALGYPVEDLRSKSWDEFATPGAPSMDFIVTVCDNAAGEMCPLWPGKPVTAHWGFPDPAAVQGSDEEKRAVFALSLQQIRNRVQLFLSLPLETLDRIAIESQMRAIGQEPLQTAHFATEED
jgi:arsenate reductase